MRNGDRQDGRVSFRERNNMTTKHGVTVWLAPWAGSGDGVVTSVVMELLRHDILVNVPGGNLTISGLQSKDGELDCIPELRILVAKLSRSGVERCMMTRMIWE